jgi:tetratricopeptide (TPR) repeat protein
MKYAVCAMVTATLVLGAAPGAVFAQDAGDSSESQMSAEERARKVEQLAAEGATAYRNGDYDNAVSFFKKAHALEPVPNLLYNIAKSYEKQEKYKEAVAYYQKFVVAPEVDTKARQAALQRIESLREIADLKEGDDAAGDGVASSGEGDDKTVEPAETDNSTAKWTMGGGVALLGAGTIVGLAMASPAADRVQTGATYADRKAAQDDARTYALVADGLLISGAVVTGIGLYLYFSDNEAAPEQTASKAVVTPWITSSSAGVGMSLDF